MTDPIITTDPTPAPDPVPTSAELYQARGHAIIHDTLARAKTLGSQYREIAALLPLIEATLHDLFAHLSVTPDAYASEVAARQQVIDDAAAKAQAETDRLAAEKAAAQTPSPSPPNDTIAGGSHPLFGGPVMPADPSPPPPPPPA